MLREILIVGAILGAKYYFSQSEKEAKQNWENKRQEAQKTLEEHQSFIDENLAKAENSYDFHYLTEIHYSSMMVGNEAYSLLKDARKTLNGINQLLTKSVKHKKNLQAQIDIKETQNKKDLKEELTALNKMRKGLFNEKELINKEQEGMLEQVRRLNKGTGTLKLHIKNHCGNKGDNWYNKIEANKKRRASKNNS